MAPFAGFSDWDECVRTMTEEEGHDEDSAEDICGALQAEAKSDHGDVDELMQALDRGAGLIADVGVDLVSGVDVPAVDSKWVMTKSGGARRGHDFRAESPVLLAKDSDTDQRISYAAAMIPREPDKEGDVVATPTVEQAAHGFLKDDGGVDTDHSLIDGEGDVVESWVLKQERQFDLPGGATETYGAGTWMVGIEWGAEAWDRIKSGDLTGLSIYGMAEHVPLSRSATTKDLTVPFADEVIVDLVYGAKTAAEKASEAMGMDRVAHEHTLDGDTVWMPGPDHETYVEVYNDIAEGEGTIDAAKAEDPCWEGYTMVGTDENGDPRCVPDDDIPDATLENAVARTASTSESPDTHKEAGAESNAMAPDNSGGGGDGAADGGDSTNDGGPDIGELAASVDSLADTVESVKDALETDKENDQEAAAMLAEDRGMQPGDILDILSVAEGKDPSEIMDAIDEVEASADGAEAKEDDMGGDEDDEDEKATAEKRASGAHLGKGSDATDTAAKGVTDDGTATSADGLSYQQLAEQAAQED